MYSRRNSKLPATNSKNTPKLRRAISKYRRRRRMRQPAARVISLRVLAPSKSSSNCCFSGFMGQFFRHEQSQLFPGPVKPAGDGLGRDVKSRGNFLVTQAVEIKQFNQMPLLRVHSKQGSVEALFKHR